MTTIYMYNRTNIKGNINTNNKIIQMVVLIPTTMVVPILIIEPISKVVSTPMVLLIPI